METMTIQEFFKRAVMKSPTLHLLQKFIYSTSASFVFSEMVVERNWNWIWMESKGLCKNRFAHKNRKLILLRPSPIFVGKKTQFIYRWETFTTVTFKPLQLASSIPYLPVTPPLNSHTNTSIHNPLIFFPNPTNSISLKSINQNPRFSSSVIRKSSSISAGASAASACSTSYPFIGKVGLHRREGNFILLSYGTNPNTGSVMAVKADISQILSAMLPFVVALTAIAALTQPLTFTW